MMPCVKAPCYVRDTHTLGEGSGRFLWHILISDLLTGAVSLVNCDLTQCHGLISHGTPFHMLKS